MMSRIMKSDDFDELDNRRQPEEADDVTLYAFDPAMTERPEDFQQQQPTMLRVRATVFFLICFFRLMCFFPALFFRLFNVSRLAI